MTSPADQSPNDLVPARRKAGWPPVVIAAREDVIQPLAACDCHPGLLLWHPGDVALVRRHELDAGREDIEAVDTPNVPAAVAAAPAPEPAPEPTPEAEPEPDAPDTPLTFPQAA